MGGDVYFWAVVALLLIAAEVMAPGAFMLWLGFAAAAMFVLAWLMPGMPIVLQAVLFVVLGFASILAYRKWLQRQQEPESDQPALNRRAAQLIGRIVPLERAIERGTGRVQIADAYWEVSGPDLPLGASVKIVGADGMTLRVEAVD
ncbi:MAG: NfeD family protein [Xanthomonadaceae bacterium]|nr:NfeD family protein [Xanthomonadaceae bacterium]